MAQWPNLPQHPNIEGFKCSFSSSYQHIKFGKKFLKEKKYSMVVKNLPQHQNVKGLSPVAAAVIGR